MTPIRDVIQDEQVEYLAARFAKGLQNTSVSSEVTTLGRNLDYDRVAARFYEEVILELRRELDKYKALAEVGVATLSATRFVFVSDEPIAVPREYRDKLSISVESAESTPEDL